MSSIKEALMRRFEKVVSGQRRMWLLHVRCSLLWVDKWLNLIISFVWPLFNATTQSGMSEPQRLAESETHTASSFHQSTLFFFSLTLSLRLGSLISRSSGSDVTSCLARSRPCPAVSAAAQAAQPAAASGAGKHANRQTMKVFLFRTAARSCFLNPRHRLCIACFFLSVLFFFVFGSIRFVAINQVS